MKSLFTQRLGQNCFGILHLALSVKNFRVVDDFIRDVSNHMCLVHVVQGLSTLHLAELLLLARSHLLVFI